ncbi:histidine kinase, partial [Streptomyces sp. NPDC051098]
AEANSNALPSSPRQLAHSADPLVAAAEASVRAAEADAEAERHERTPDGEPETVGTDQGTFEMRLPETAEPAPQAPSPVPAQAPAETQDWTQALPAEPESRPRPEPVGDRPAPVWDRVTDKGLPKRTPKVVQPATTPGERTGSIDADALRRRLGGFQQAAEEGRRDAQSEIERTAPQTTTEDAGDTVEEARS